LAVVGTLALAACAPGPPAQRGPAPTLTPRLPAPDLNEPGGAQINAQLRQLRQTPRLCIAVLERTAGLAVTPLADKLVSPGCGYFGAVEITRSLVPINRRTQAACAVVAGLHLWMRDVLQPAARLHLGEPIARVESFGTYGCRPRNNQPGAPMSEHATANAIDISGFVTASGRRVTVLQGWRGQADEAAFLRAVHRQSCRLFSVVLGPESDRFHQDHFHFDMGPFRACR
jgi:hypothetical protein